MGWVIYINISEMVSGEIRKALLIEPHLLGSLEYFVLLDKASEVIWETHEHFRKQTFRNRFYINTSQGPMPLIVPVSYGNRTTFREVTIDYRQRWIKEHWGAIYSSYGKSPFFEHFSDLFHDILERRPKFLLDLCQMMMTICLKVLQSDMVISETERYDKMAEMGILDYRNHIHPKKTFAQRDIYKPFPYIQNFGSNFVPNLSIIDALFSEGPQTCSVIEKSARKER
ncbi:MAG: WbqC family protein [Cyclobacteriaceae bacterium]|nr:WbqC family protein [Cyclobacteriaceae bacterium HetDA_MAG_MS6]